MLTGALLRLEGARAPSLALMHGRGQGHHGRAEFLGLSAVQRELAVTVWSMGIPLPGMRCFSRKEGCVKLAYIALV